MRQTAYAVHAKFNLKRRCVSPATSQPIGASSCSTAILFYPLLQAMSPLSFVFDLTRTRSRMILIIFHHGHARHRRMMSEGGRVRGVLQCGLPFAHSIILREEVARQ